MKKVIIVVLGIVCLWSMKALAVQYNSLGGVSVSTSVATGGFQVLLASATNWKGITPTAAGQLVGCTDCSVGTLCISTGTGTGSYVSITSGTVNSSVPCK